MNNFELMIHRLKRFFAELKQSGSSSPKRNPGRPDLKMCPICRKLVPSKAQTCEYCEAELNPKPQATINSDGSAVAEPMNPTFIVFGLCCLFYFLTIVLSGKVDDYSLSAEFWSPAGSVLVRMGANFVDPALGQFPIVQRFTYMISHYEWWRIAGYMFLHGSLMHIFFNLSALGQLGPMTWSNFGTRRFWLISLLTGMSGGLLSVVAALLGLQPGFSVGFSGALFGYIGANYYYFKNRGMPEISERLKKFMIWGNVIFFGLTVAGIMQIDNFAHLGGMFGGLLLGKMFDLKAVRKLPPITERIILALCFFVWGYGLVRCGMYIQSWLG